LHRQRNHTNYQGRSQTFWFGEATGGASFATRGAVNGLCLIALNNFSAVAWRHAENFGGPLGGQTKFWGQCSSLAPPSSAPANYLANVDYFNLKQNPTVQVHFKESSLLHSFLPLCSLAGNASKITYDVTKLFTTHGEQPGCFKSAWLHWHFFSLFIYLNSSVTEQPAVMLEQTSNNRSTMLKNIFAGWDNGTNKDSCCH